MMKVLTIFCLLPMLSSGIIYFDRVTSDFNPKLVDFAISFTSNAKGASVTNLTFNIFENVTSCSAYIKMTTPENANDREYKLELLRTVVDVDKVFKGSQSNPLIKMFIDSILKYADFEMKFPLTVVSFLSALRLMSVLLFFNSNREPTDSLISSLTPNTFHFPEMFLQSFQFA